MFYDDHNPPHFHAYYGGQEISINIEDGKVKGEFPRRALKLVYDWYDLHKNEIMENWNRAKNGEQYFNIKPLD
jgi:hypothetical protein